MRVGRLAWLPASLSPGVNAIGSRLAGNAEADGLAVKCRHHRRAERGSEQVVVKSGAWRRPPMAERLPVPGRAHFTRPALKSRIRAEVGNGNQKYSTIFSSHLRHRAGRFGLMSNRGCACIHPQPVAMG